MFTVIGIGLLLFSVSDIKNYKQKNETYTETTAEVIDHDYDSDDLAAIVVEYTVDGQTYKKQSNSYSNNPTPLGGEVKVKYNPDNPSDAIFANDSTNIIPLIIGGMFVIVGMSVFIKGARSRKDEEDSLVQQSNGMYNGADNTLQNSSNLIPNSQIQTPVQSQVNPPQPDSQYNQSQGTIISNIDYANGQKKIDNNQNNISSNL